MKNLNPNRPMFTDVLSASRCCINDIALIKASLDIVNELVKVASSSNDSALINLILTDVQHFESTIFNYISNYEHRTNTETECLDDNLGDN